MIGLLVVAQLAVVSHAPDTATSCAPITVTVAARAPGSVAPQIVPRIAASPFQLLKSTVVSRVERDGVGRPTSLTEGTFIVATSAAGRVPLPVFAARVGAHEVVATPSPVNVEAAGVLPPVVIVRAWLDRANAGGGVDTLYVGQQVDYVVDVQLNESARQRLRRNPTFFPPEMPGVLAYDLAPPAALTRVGRRCFETLSYRRALFPLFAGRTAIAPAALTYSLPLSTSFFSREESFELRTDSVRFLAQDVPLAGRPPEFAGAVGALGATTRLSTPGARMGDPVVLTLRLEGTGNVKLWPRPALSLGWATIASGGERVQVDTSRAVVRGVKEFDWLLTPRQAGRQEVTTLSYPYFDPEQRKYSTATTTTIGLDVASASLAAIDSTPTARLAIRRTLRGEIAPPMPSRPWFWILLAMAPLPATVRRVRNRVRGRGTALSAMRRLSLATEAKDTLPARSVRRLFLDAIAERVPSAAGPTERTRFVRALRHSGVTDVTANAAGDLLHRLDSAAFSSSGVIDRNALAESAALVSAIDAQAVRVRQPASARRISILVLIASLSAPMLHAFPDGVANSFRQGVEAYDQREFPRSQQLFERVVARAPRAVDAWSNLGAVAYARGDSAGAVRAWQRTLRLDPLDAEARERLNAVHPPVLRAPGYVAPLPVNALAIAALLFWIGAWAMLALPPARRPANGRALAGGGLAIALVLLATTVEVHQRLDARGLAVLRSDRLLLEAPGSSTAIASAVLGETGMLGAREGAWVRLTLDATRVGWVPMSGVLVLEDR